MAQCGRPTMESELFLCRLPGRLGRINSWMCCTIRSTATGGGDDDEDDDDDDDDDDGDKDGDWDASTPGCAGCVFSIFYVFLGGQILSYCIVK